MFSNATSFHLDGRVHVSEGTHDGVWVYFSGRKTHESSSYVRVSQQPQQLLLRVETSIRVLAI